MKEGRTINIRDPRLRRIRDNLRLIILKECIRRKSEITECEHNLTHDKDGSYIRISSKTSKKIQKLANTWWEIERPLRASIVKCRICSKSNKNMTYHKKSGTWFCEEHYKIQVNSGKNMEI